MLHVVALALVSAVTAPPAALVAEWRLSPVYVKHVDVEGVPVLGSAKVSDAALLEAAYLMRNMIGHRPEVLRAIASRRVRFVVMAPDEMTTDVPEHSDLTPKAHWDRRARGLGATTARPATSCGEENLLELEGDPYATENILLHEFAHTIHEMGLDALEARFDARLQEAYGDAKKRGLWSKTYAMENHREYWAEGTQSWFDTNRENDNEHGAVNTRAELKAYDEKLAALLQEVYGDGAWRYAKPSMRGGAGGVKRAPKPTTKFVWPDQTAAKLVDGALTTGRAPASARGVSAATSISFVNERARDVSVFWVDPDGTRRHYFDLRPGRTQVQGTYVGHVWVISDGERDVGFTTATAAATRLTLR
jgi:hypothetical protein